jgi:hypothetical protein
MKRDLRKHPLLTRLMSYSRYSSDTTRSHLFSNENQVHNYMHARIKFHAYCDIKVYTEIVSRMKEKDCQSITLYPGNEGSKHHRQSTGVRVRLALINIFTRLRSSLLLLSNIVYSKGEHLSYSASVGKVMNAKAL